MAETVACPKCRGSRVEVDWRERRPIKGPCPECRGTGVVSRPVSQAGEPFIAHEKETT